MSRTDMGGVDSESHFNFNTFYKAPIGKENWQVKHINPPKQSNSVDPVQKYR